MLASIPYTTFPNIELGPLTLRTFGLMVALGVLIGARLGSDYGERFGINREDTYRTGTLMVLAGIIGSRLTWAATHTESIHNPLDVIAIWRGGIQFSGGFIAALIVGIPMFRKWNKVQRWHVLNGYAWGLAIGVAIGRIGCYAVGEHFGRTTDFFLGTRFDGGDVREPFLGDAPLVKGTVFHNTALYEGLLMFGLFLAMTAIILWARHKGREVLPGTLVAVFMLWAGISRFGTDSLRVNDERAAGLTGAQWMSVVMVPYGLYVLFRIRPMLRKLVGPDGKALDDATGGSGSLLEASDDESDDDKPVPDELAAPENGAATAKDDSDDSSDDSSDDDTSSEPKAKSAKSSKPSKSRSSKKAAAEKTEAEVEPKGDSADEAESADEPEPVVVESADDAEPDSDSESADEAELTAEAEAEAEAEADEDADAAKATAQAATSESSK